MKTTTKKIMFISGLALLILNACQKDGIKTVSNGGQSGMLSTTSTSLVLSNAQANDTTVTFNLTHPSYGFSAVYSTTLQIDGPGDNWAHAASFALNSKTTKQSFTTSDFNALLLKLNLAGGIASTVSVRVVNSLGQDVAPNYSNVLTLNVTPYNLTSWLYIVGAFQGWNASSPDSLFSATSNGIYTGIINFTAGNNQFLILPKKTYDNKYATTDPATTSATMASYSTELVSGGGNNFAAPTTAGNYLLTLNINTNTLTISPVNAYSAIGSTTPGGNYSTDDDLKFVNSTNQDWEAVLPFTAGAFKIRQNHDWTWSWGTIGTPDGVSLTDASGGNISVATAGNYKVTFSIPTTSITTTPPPTSATYTLTKQ